jgi:carbamoyl-phosphate synthase large subunit
MKAVRGAEISLDTLNMPKFANRRADASGQMLKNATDERLFAIYEL